LTTLILGVTFFLGGCTHFQQTLTGDEKTFPSTNPESIALYFPNESPQRSYNEIVYVIAEKGNTKDAIQFLKKNAAKMGADALVNCEVHVYRRLVVIILFIPIFEDNHIASGVAIKYSQTSF